MLLSLALALTLAPAPKVSGWLALWDDGAGFASIKANASRVGDVCVEWMVVTPEGRAVRRPYDNKTTRGHLAEMDRLKLPRYAMVSNYIDGFTAKPVQAFLASPEKTRQQVDDLVQIAKADGFDGIDIDYENLEKGDRDRYSTFIEELSRRCKTAGLKLSIAVHAKTSEPGTWDGVIAQDWPRLGKAVDVFRIMTYDQHWSTSEAGAIASPEFVRNVLKFAVSVVPARKIEVGIAAYGYDWSKKPAPSLTWTDWTELVKKHGPAQRHPGHLELQLRTPGGIAGFADGPAQQPKIELAQEFKVRALAMWRFGSEDPAFWQLFK